MTLPQGTNRFRALWSCAHSALWPKAGSRVIQRARLLSLWFPPCLVCDQRSNCFQQGSSIQSHHVGGQHPWDGPLVLQQRTAVTEPSSYRITELCFCLPQSHPRLDSLPSNRHVLCIQNTAWKNALGDGAQAELLCFLFAPNKAPSFHSSSC